MNGKVKDKLEKGNVLQGRDIRGLLEKIDAHKTSQLAQG